MNTVRNNKSHGVGAGIHLEYGGGIVIGNLVYSNQSGGGGAFDVSGGVGAVRTFVANNTFAYNTYGGGGSESDDEAVSQVFFGPFVDDGSTIAFVNNIVAGDTAEPAVACGSLSYVALLSFAGLRRRARILRSASSLLLLLSIACCVTACGGNSAIPGTPIGPYALTITATSATTGPSTPLTHTLTLTANITGPY